jgi:two-component system, chemotaxis family, chemotaxis protein CheY
MVFNIAARNREVGAMRSCLVVDGSEIVRSIARGILEDLDFAVEEAADGDDALRRCRERAWDCVLLEWNVPGPSGRRLLERLRASPHGGAAVIIVCTTDNEPADIRAAIDGGVDEYVMKPFDSEIIQTKLAQTGLLKTGVEALD